MAKRKRDMQLNFRVSAEELAVIEQKMSQFGTSNREAYLRKMALDGYVVKLELPELKELVSLMRRSSNNLNQLTRKVHETGRVYDADLEDISQRQEQLWEHVLKSILESDVIPDMGGRRGNHYPAFQTLITGIDTPFAEGGTALLRCSSLRFFFLSVSLSFACPCRII